MKNEDCKIFIIDDDQAVLRSLSLLLTSAGYDTEPFITPGDFFSSVDYDGAGCIFLDVFLKGRTGLELQEEILNRYENLPIIYISGYGDIPMSVQALKKGAINFLQKPISDGILLKAVDEALTKSHQVLAERKEIARFRSRVETLTPRELEIFKYVITGMLNKQIAAKLNIVEHTVKLHRSSITEKLGVKSVAEMVHIAQKLNVHL